MDILDCGEVNCEYCSKDKCIYMKGDFMGTWTISNEKLQNQYVKDMVNLLKRAGFTVECIQDGIYTVKASNAEDDELLWRMFENWELF